MRVLSISGTLGSGKTTVIKELAEKLCTTGKRVAIIVNEDGNTAYDEVFTERLNIPVKHLRGGWMGCSLAASLVDLKKKLKRSIDPDYLFLEPSEMIVTRELRQVLSMGLRDIKYTIGPLITLIDSASFAFNWEERKKLLLGQVQDTDQIALTRVDLIDEKQIKHICGFLKIEQNDTLRLSWQESESLDIIGQKILSMDETTQCTT